MENSGYFSEKRLREIEEKLDRLMKDRYRRALDPDSIVLDNSELMRHLKISNKTATIWRNQGKIAFSKVNQKLYYKLSDVKKLIEDHRVFPVVKPNKNRNQNQ